MKGPKQAAIERGIRAVQKLGLPVVKVQFDAAGNIAIFTAPENGLAGTGAADDAFAAWETKNESKTQGPKGCNQAAR